MPDHKLCVALLLVLGLLLVGCSSGSGQLWSLSWSPARIPGSASRVNPPEVAYASCAYAVKPDGTTLHPAKSIWLATGSNPEIGLALSQLDPAAQFYSVGVTTVDSGSNWWTLTDSGTVERPAPGSGVPAAQEEGAAWQLPAGTYSSITLEVPDTQPGGSVQLWVSDRGQEFALARLYTTIQPPAGYTSVTLANQPGWLTTRDGFTIIGLSLASGIYQGLGTLLFAGTTSIEQSERLATQAALDLNDLLPA